MEGALLACAFCLVWIYQPGAGQVLVIPFFEVAEKILR